MTDDKKKSCGGYAPPSPLPVGDSLDGASRSHPATGNSSLDAILEQAIENAELVAFGLRALALLRRYGREYPEARALLEDAQQILSARPTDQPAIPGQQADAKRTDAPASEDPAPRRCICGEINCPFMLENDAPVDHFDAGRDDRAGGDE